MQENEDELIVQSAKGEIVEQTSGFAPAPDANLRLLILEQRVLLKPRDKELLRVDSWRCFAKNSGRQQVIKGICEHL